MTRAVGAGASSLERVAVACTCWLALTACAVPRTPATLPPSTTAYVAVLSGEMPGAISQVARHSWIVANVPGESALRRYEMGSSSADPFRYFGEGDVAVLMLGDNTFLGAFGGLGVTGFGEAVPSRFQLPAELRVEIDVARAARVGARFSAEWYPADDAATAGYRPISFADEIVLSTFVRLGECRCPGRLGRGYLFALERGEVLNSAWVGASFGVKADFGG